MPGKQFDECRLIEAEFRIVDTEARTITGVAAPYNRWTPIAGAYLERFTSETFAESVRRGGGANAPLLMHHDHKDMPVGKPLEWRDTDEGLVGVWEIDVKRDAGAEAWRLADEGYLRALSVGFQAGDADDVDTSGEVTRVTRGPARLLEVSLVSVPAVEDARITKVRSAGPRPGPDPRIAAYRAALGLIEERS